MSQQILYLMLGYPGSGKTTTANIIQHLTGAVHLSSDTLRLELFPQPSYSQAEHDAVYKELDKRAEELLQNGKNVIYDANLNRYVHRVEKYALCQRTGARPLLVWIRVPRDTARSRAVLRGHRHLVPKDETFESMFDRVANAIEQPQAHEKVITLDGNVLNEKTIAEALKQA